MDLINSNKKYNHNKNGLVLPFLFNITDIDPIKNGIEHNCPYVADFPDIDSDFLPYARDEIKRYAAEKYGIDKVCTVGNWNTLKLKQALQDSCRVLEGDMSEVIRLTKSLDNDEYDKMDLEDLCSNSSEFNDYYQINKEIVELALELRGRIKSQGQHAGGIIISSTPLSETIPMSYIKGKFISQWTEGMASTQLSPFGLVKFDILGLKTMAYNAYAEELVEKTRGIKIDWSECDPSCEEPYAGFQSFPDGTVKPILLNDPVAIKMADDIKTEAVFQFDTPVAKGVLSNGVKNFDDLVTYTAMARPGPMETIPEYVARRDDDKELWKKKEDPRVAKLLEKTYGIVVYQEDLTKLWTKFGGLTVPEAEKARKAVAKKKKEEIIKLGPKITSNMVKNGFPNHKLPQNDEGIYEGAEPYSAQGYWNRMVSFGRYCFNMSHAYAYGLIAYRSLWLKAHYKEEFWASQLTYRPTDKIPKYIGVAKSEGVRFESFKCGNLSSKLTVDKDLNVRPSLIMVKGIGASFAESMDKTGGECSSIDDFVERYGKKKAAIERLIKLGAFDDIHPRIKKQLWFWYQYKYCSKNEENMKIKNIYYDWYMNKHWPEDKLKEERQRQQKEFKKLFPKKKIPIRIIKWSPKIGPKHDKPTRQEFVEFFTKLWNDHDKDDKNYNEKDKYYYTNWNLKDNLEFEKQYLGIYLTSPMKMFKHNRKFVFSNIKNSDKKCGPVDGVIETISFGLTKKGTKFTNMSLNDGIETNIIRVWGDSWEMHDQRILKEGCGVRVPTEWSEKFQNFNLARNCTMHSLPRKDIK
jgi:DNA polymerase III alpha subunit